MAPRSTRLAERTLTARQAEAAVLVRSYVEFAGELPSSGWLARRLNVSRQRAYQFLELFGERRLRLRE
jgi:hypothetical protein